MLQTATWGLGRRQRRLLPLVTPILVSHHSISKTTCRYAAGAAETAAVRDEGAKSSASPTPNREPNAFMANSTSHERGLHSGDDFFLEPEQDHTQLNTRQRRKLKRRLDVLSKRRQSDLVSENIDPSFFEKFGDRRIEDDSEDQMFDHPLLAADDLSETLAAGFLPSQLRNPSKGFSAKDELEAVFDSFKYSDGNSCESEIGMAKSYDDTGPGYIIKRSLADDSTGDAWRKKLASMRSVRMPIIIMQMMIRRDVLRSGEDRALLDRLPKGEHLKTIIQLIVEMGYTRQDLRDMMHILRGATDWERCQRFLNLEGPKPIWLYHFVIRRGARVGSITMLKKLITYCATTYDGRIQPKGLEPKGLEPKGLEPKELEPKGLQDDQHPSLQNDQHANRPDLDMRPHIFCHTIKYLAAHCMALEDRLLLNVADLAIAFITNIGSWDLSEERRFFYQCELFNEGLHAFSPSNNRLAPMFPRDMQNYWEAQKRLLSMSAGLDQQLLVSKLGFRAVRTVLSGLEKNAAEIHNSKRHAITWPPYLLPGDGIDEAKAPEDNWSRTVAAGTLQQEAGFPLDEEDEALDTLQGKAPDGTPTIQQRLSRSPPKIDTWTASIKATRSAVEAWDKFCHPPKRGLTPSVYQYGAMFSKLHLREADPALGLRPGDRPLNFPVKQDPNLSDFALARMAPPSVDVLYREMRAAGISPIRMCLDVLVANAESLDVAHKYLKDSRERTWPLTVPHPGGPSAASLREVRTPLVAAYVKAACSQATTHPQNLLRAIQICDKRFSVDDSSRAWASFAWGSVLKACSDMRSGTGGIGKSLAEQLGAYNLIVEKIERSGRPTLATLVQFSKCLRSAAARALGTYIRDPEFAAGMQDSPLRFMYDAEFREELAQDTSLTGAGLSRYGIRGARWLPLFASAAQRMKEMIKTLEDGESETSDLLNTLHMPLECMQARKDLVRATDASHVMACWAFLGEYEMMASLLELLAEQWSNPEIVQQLDSYEVLPSFADFNELLCIFRRFAEPMLPEERVNGLRAKVDSAELAWTWPNEELLMAFDETRNAVSYQRLRHVLEWTRYRQARRRGEDPETLLRPQKWVEAESSKHAYQNAGFLYPHDPKT